MSIIKNLLLSSMALVCISCSSKKEERVILNVQEQLQYCHNQVEKTLEELGCDGSINYRMMPRNILNGEAHWNCREASELEWCGGFWPGVLWYDFENTGDSTILAEAKKFTESLSFLAEKPVYDHDLGFLTITSFINGYRLTNDENYKHILLECANNYKDLFNPAVGTFLSWPRHVADYGGHNTIMDNMINLELLFWAAKNGGGEDLRLMAISHADKTMKYHFHDDAIGYHVAVYDPETGKFLRGCTHQGYADLSMWARGQSWAIYGYTMVYRETGDEKYLDFAQKVADIYLKQLPEDYIPYWDFFDPTIPNAPKDASAACVVASALIELSTFVEGEKGVYYLDMAKKMLSSLSTDAYQCKSQSPAFLLHSVGHKPAGSEIDASIIYTDYYYIEALTRLKELEYVIN